MKERHATGPYKSTPVPPIPLDSLLRVVSVNKQQIDQLIPPHDRFVAEFLNPNHFSTVTTSNSSPGDTLHEI